MKRWGSLLLSIVFCVAAIAPGLSEGEGRSEEQLYEELIVGTATAMTGQFFTDAFGTNTADIDVRSLLHGYHLVKWNGADCAFGIDQTVVSGLVSVAQEDGGKQFIIALTNDLQYSDGTPITAKDYVFSILLTASPQMAAVAGMAANLTYIAGAKEYMDGKTSVLSGVRLLGERQFSITISGDSLPFFFEMGWLDFCPYPISVIAPGCEVKDEGKGALIQNMDPEVKKPIFTEALLKATVLDPEKGYLSHPAVTSGPYVLTSYDADAREAKFALNSYYKVDTQGKKPTIPQVTFRYMEPGTMIDEIRGGKVDLLNKCVQAEVIQAGMPLASAGVAFRSSYPRSGLSFISFACEQGPAQFQSVRQALALCLDRDQFVADYVQNFGQKVNGYYGEGQWMQQLVNGTLPPPLEQIAEQTGGEGTEAYQKAVEAWDALNLDSLDAYEVDMERAKGLLTKDGWTLNEAGKDFTEGTDFVRCKKVDGKLMPLSLSIMVTENHGIEAKLEGWQQNLAALGIRLTVEAKPYEVLLSRYYRKEPRGNDMFFIGSNFLTLFDPTGAFSVFDSEQGALNTTGLRDEKLMQLALDMRRTEPGDLFGYCQKWVAFQEYWNEVLPMIPLYSNTYFDFYAPRLRDYGINENITWAEALNNAYLSDALELEDGLQEGIGVPVPVGAPVPVGGQPIPVN